MSQTNPVMRGSRSSGYIRLHAGPTALAGLLDSPSCRLVRRRSFDKLFDTFAYVRPHARAFGQTSRDGPAEEVAVLVDRAGQDREVDLTVVIDSHEVKLLRTLTDRSTLRSIRADTASLIEVSFCLSMSLRRAKRNWGSAPGAKLTNWATLATSANAA